jgi:hypothetical protein
MTAIMQGTYEFREDTLFFGPHLDFVLFNLEIVTIG